MSDAKLTSKDKISTRNERVRELKKACNDPKSELIRIWRELADLHGTKARTLEAVIAKLEKWQNTP